MQKKIIIAVAVVALLASAIYIVTGTRLLKNSPNIVIILADDMDRNLLPYIEKTNELIGAQGATFDNFFITTPLCCPSRTSILRGQYAHNTDILENSPGFARFFKLKEEEDALPVWLNEAGYKTALFGKYLNNYPVNAGRNYVPPGWTDWGVFLGTNYEGDYYYNYNMNVNGTIVEHGTDPEDYSTDVIKDKSIQFINDSVSDGSPFFLFISAYAPHGPATSAPRHADLFNDLTYPQAPSFGEADLSDKPEIIRALTETGDDFDENDANVFFQNRVRSLQALDELVEQVVRTLEENGELENTYIFFLSDNGFHLGEHNIPSGKGTAYEEDIHVPFMVRGPDIAPGTQITQLSANIDLAPTIAEITGIGTPNFVDGRSLLPWLTGENTSWRNGLLVEFGYGIQEAFLSGGQNISFANRLPDSMIFLDEEKDNLLVDVEGGSFRGIRAENYLYVEYENGEAEFYDLATDPYQLENIAGTLSADTLNVLQTKLNDLKACTGSQCRVLEEELNIEFK